MPSPLETLVKILKLERQQGFKNNAVIGGLGAYGENWTDEAHRYARRPEHHLLVDELSDLLREYEALENKNERHQTISYMLDRITGREPIPEQYQARIGEYEAEEELASSPQTPETTVEDDVDSKAAAPDAAMPPEPDSVRPVSQPAPAENRKRGTTQKPSTSGDAKKDKATTPYFEENSIDPWLGDKGPSSPRLDIAPQPRLRRPPRRRRRHMDAEEAVDVMRGLSATVDTVKGVGPRMAAMLNKLGMYTINDLLFFFPRRYDDYTQMRYISKLKPFETVVVVGTVCHTQVQEGKNQRKHFFLKVDDGSGTLQVSFFGQPFLQKQIRKGKQLVLSGQTTVYQGQIRMNNPEWEELDSDNLHTVGIVPVYPLTKGLRARSMRRLMQKTVQYWSKRLPDYVPEATLERAELADLGWAISQIHFPDGQDHLEHARNRIIFDQLLLMQLSILANRREWQSVPGTSLDITDDFLEPFIQAVFPYELTRAQRRAIDDIRRDISRDVPMNRLLQGDVGSGKTAVATAALAMAFSNGKQAALMAPTSILAEQHYRGISASLENMPGDNKPIVALLTGALTSTEREAVYNGLRDGSIDIVIGTHALIQEGLEFHDLALAIVDEQHRFGVEQRGKLRGKGTNPHLLVMTATPIPRTLALTLYADLDLSIMDEMPPGRIPIQTRIVQPVERERIYSFVESQIEKGRQAFIVHPLVEASETIDARAAVEAYEQLQHVFFRHRVGLLHGRMKPAEKDEIMAAFANHEFDIMVTTSVAEVGVDIPNASTIVIEGANRFGLAQLHQFRGRVGRGQHASYCLLIPDNNAEDSMQRLKAMEDTTDGFKLAEIDWQLRGAGDLVGTRQSGRNTLKIMEFLTPEMVALARNEARTIYEEDPYLEQDEHYLLKQRVDMLYNEGSDLS